MTISHSYIYIAMTYEQTAYKKVIRINSDTQTSYTPIFNKNNIFKID